MTQPNQYEDEELASAIDDIMLITGKQRGARMREAILQLIAQKQLALLDELKEYAKGEANGFENVPSLSADDIEAMRQALTKQKGK